MQLELSQNLTLVILALAAAGAGWAAVRGANGGHAARPVLVLGLVVLPLMALTLSTRHAITTSARTEFCVSCHEMHDFGASLLIDDPAALPAVHYQNGLVDRERACYVCHTDYAMFGNAKAKFNGIKHVLVHAFGTPPATTAIELYSPYPNENCLHCHRGTRGFEAQPAHDSDEVSWRDLESGETSCMASGCHDLVHPVERLGEFDYWSRERKPAALSHLNLPPPPEPEFDLDAMFAAEEDDTEAGAEPATEAAP